MSYFSNNKLFHYYEVNDNNLESNSITKDTIEVLNNEKIRFDFSNLHVYAPIHGVLNSSDVETTKIIVDWGDGTIDRLTKPLVSNASTIGAYRPNSWKVVEHLFNVEKRYEYKTDNTLYYHRITITAFNNFNDQFVIEIPYKILYKTIYDLGSELSMFSANTTNTNKVSYTLKQKATDSLFVVNSLDWRTIYGDEENVVIEETVAEVFSDEFANEDIMVWDWKTPPVIDITITDYPTSKTIICNFEEKGVSVESWHPQLLLLQDTGNIRIYTKKDDEKVYTYSALMSEDYCVAEDPDISVYPDDYDFPIGVYETYINPLVGINGVSTRSGSQYVLYNSEINPRCICQQVITNPETNIIDIVDPITVDDSVDNDIKFNFTLPPFGQLVSLNKLELTLKAFRISDNAPIEDIEFTYDVLTPLFNEEHVPFYVINGTDKNFTHSIKMRDIPNYVQLDYVDEDGEIKSENQEIYYRAFIRTNDVLGGDDNILMYDAYCNETINGQWDEIKDNITFGNYTIGSFATEDLTISEIDQLTKTFTISWQFEKKDEWDQFIATMVRDDEHLLSDIHDHISGNDFIGLDYDEETQVFSKTIDTNKFSNGDVVIDIAYRVNMGNFYDYREEKLSKEYTLTYPNPIIDIYDIQPYYTINYNKLTNVQTLVLNTLVRGHSDEELKNISITEGTSQPVILSELLYSDKNVGFTTQDISYVYKAANNADLFNRIGESESTVISIGEVSNLTSIPQDGIDYLSGNVASRFIVEEDKIKVDWIWVKENTLHDVDKLYKWVLEDGKELFGGEQSGNFTFDEEQRHALYEIVTLNRDGDLIRRFRPYIANGELDITKRTELPNASTFFNTDLTFGKNSYERAIDKGVIDVVWSEQDIPKVKNMWLTLTKGGENLQTIDIKNSTSHTFTNLEFGDDYSYYIVLNSEYNNTKNNRFQGEDIQVLIHPEESIQFTSEPVATAASSTASYVTFAWVLYHKSCEDVKLYYKDMTGKSGEFAYVKQQNSIQPTSFPNTYQTTDGETTATKRNVITYGFKIKSDYIYETEDYKKDEDGYITVHENTFEL